MSASVESRNKLAAALRPLYARTVGAGGALARAQQAAEGAQDLVLHYAAAARVILALEALEATAKQAARDMRAALHASFNETGCPEVSDDALTVYLAKEPAVLTIDDPRLVPPDLMARPQPDRKEIAAALKAGRRVPGVSMLTRNSQRLVIRPRS